MQDPSAMPQETSTSIAAPRISHEDLLSEILQDFFAIHEPAFTQTLIDGATFLEIAPGERLFRQGDRSSDVYFVLNGRMKAIREDARMRPARSARSRAARRSASWRLSRASPAPPRSSR